MSEIKKENQNSNFSLDSFDDEDDLWALQSDKKNEQSVDIDGFDEDETFDLSTPIEEKVSEPISVENETKPEEIEQKTSEMEEESLPLVAETEAEINQDVDDSNSIVDEEEAIIDSASDSSTLENDDSLSSSHSESELNRNLNLLVQNSLKDLEAKRHNLEMTIAKLERRRDKIEQEMNSTFAGASQNLAIKVQGFKDYLVGSLEDLVAAAEQLDLDSKSEDSWEQTTPTPPAVEQKDNYAPQFAEKNFAQERNEIRRLLDQYRTRPDYYGPPWQLRRTFEPIHAQKVADWFFTQGGRGALTSMGSRLQNILLGSAIISILSHLYGDRSRILILADTPEKLGEWRRGLQDCLGISRSDFGPNRGIILFETTTALITKGDRIVEEGDLPLVIMDLNDDRVSLSLLKFPLWLAFAPASPVASQDYYY